MFYILRRLYENLMNVTVNHNKNSFLSVLVIKKKPKKKRVEIKVVSKQIN